MTNLFTGQQVLAEIAGPIFAELLANHRDRAPAPDAPRLPEAMSDHPLSTIANEATAVLVGQPRGPEALAQYAEAVRLAPGNAIAQLNLGVALGQSGRLPEAVTHLAEAARLQPESAEAHYNLAYALLASGRRADARPHLQESLRLQPGYAAARNLLQRLDAAGP